MICDPYIPLLALRREDLDPAEQTALEAHLGDCQACRARLERVEVLDRAVRSEIPGMGRPFRRSGLPGRWAWAAGLAAAVLIGVWRGASSRAPEPLPAAPATGTVATLPAWDAPSGLLEPRGEDRECLLGSSALVSLRAGGRVLLDPPAHAVTLQQGALHADTRGDRLAIRVGEVLLEAEEATLCAEVLEGRTPPFSWLAAAHADEVPALSVVVRRGRISLRAGDLLLALQEGEGGVWRQGRFDRGTPACWEPAPWRKLDVPALLRDGVLELPVPSGGYLIEMLVSRKDPRAELGLRLAAGGRVFEIPVGSAWRGAGWTRLRLAVGGGRCRASVGGVPLVDSALEALGRWPEAAGKEPGIRAWGGDLEIRDVRWRIP
jgi:hypothetical protein